jgi:hypothetical protein
MIHAAQSRDQAVHTKKIRKAQNKNKHQINNWKIKMVGTEQYFGCSLDSSKIYNYTIRIKKRYIGSTDIMRLVTPNNSVIQQTILL